MGMISVATNKMYPSTERGENTLDSLYSRNPGAAQVAPGQPATAGLSTSSTAKAGTGSSQDAASRGYATSTREVGDSELSSTQLNKITSLDSPLMQRARQEGMMTAARRGLQNSSIAAGAAEGALVDRATPFALQDSATIFSQARANQDAVNAQGQFEAGAANTAELQNAAQATDTSNRNAGLETETSISNARAEDQSSAQNAALKTDASKFNSGLEQDRNQANAASENALRQQTLQQNADLNRQFLQGQQSLDLATIQGQFQQLISTNETAASFYTGYFNTIGQLMANSKDLGPERLAQLIRVNQDQLAAGLKLIDSINGVDFSGAAQNPTVTSSGSNVVSTPSGTAPGADTRPSLETKLVGDTQLPSSYEVRATGKKGYYGVYDNGTLVGTLVPGGKNGRYQAVGK